MLNSKIELVCEEIKKIFSPLKIIIYSQKTTLSGEVSSFKLCLVLETDSPEECERKIYSIIDSEIPFDVLIYTLDDWEKFSKQKDCFAEKIKRTGVIIYE